MPIALGDDVMPCLYGTLAEEELTSRARVVMRRDYEYRRNFVRSPRASKTRPQSRRRADRAWHNARRTRSRGSRNSARRFAPILLSCSSPVQGRIMELAEDRDAYHRGAFGPGEIALITARRSRAAFGGCHRRRGLITPPNFAPRPSTARDWCSGFLTICRNCFVVRDAMRLAAAGPSVSFVVSSGDSRGVAWPSAVFEARSSAAVAGAYQPRLAGRDGRCWRAAAACRRRRSAIFLRINLSDNLRALVADRERLRLARRGRL